MDVRLTRASDVNVCVVNDIGLEPFLKSLMLLRADLNRKCKSGQSMRLNWQQFGHQTVIQSRNIIAHNQQTTEAKARERGSAIENVEPKACPLSQKLQRPASALHIGSAKGTAILGHVGLPCPQVPLGGGAECTHHTLQLY